MTGDRRITPRPFWQVDHYFKSTEDYPDELRMEGSGKILKGPEMHTGTHTNVFSRNLFADSALSGQSYKIEWASKLNKALNRQGGKLSWPDKTWEPKEHVEEFGTIRDAVVDYSQKKVCVQVGAKLIDTYHYMKGSKKYLNKGFKTTYWAKILTGFAQAAIDIVANVLFPGSGIVVQGAVAAGAYIAGKAVQKTLGAVGTVTQPELDTSVAYALDHPDLADQVTSALTKKVTEVTSELLTGREDGFQVRTVGEGESVQRGGNAMRLLGHTSSVVSAAAAAGVVVEAINIGGIGIQNMIPGLKGIVQMGEGVHGLWKGHAAWKIKKADLIIKVKFIKVPIDTALALLPGLVPSCDGAIMRHGKETTFMQTLAKYKIYGNNFLQAARDWENKEQAACSSKREKRRLRVCRANGYDPAKCSKLLCNKNVMEARLAYYRRWSKKPSSGEESSSTSQKSSSNTFDISKDDMARLQSVPAQQTVATGGEEHAARAQLWSASKRHARDLLEQGRAIAFAEYRRLMTKETLSGIDALTKEEVYQADALEFALSCDNEEGDLPPEQIPEDCKQLLRELEQLVPDEGPDEEGLDGVQ